MSALLGLGLVAGFSAGSRLPAAEPSDAPGAKLAEPIQLSGAQPKPADAQVKHSWSGYVPSRRTPGMRQGADEMAGLLAEVPTAKVITDQQKWAKVWKDWTTAAAAGMGGGRRPGPPPDLGEGPDKPPVIDFSTDMVLVCLSQSSIATFGPLALDNAGNLTLQAHRVAADGGSGYGFIFIQVSRAGIKSVNGVAVPSAGAPEK